MVQTIDQSSTSWAQTLLSPHPHTSCLRMSEFHTNAQRNFSPLYKSTGNESVDRLAFFHILERLKVRTSVPRNTSYGPDAHQMPPVDSKAHGLGGP